MTKDLKNSALYEECYGIRERRTTVRWVAILLTLITLFFGVRLYWVNHYGGVQVNGPSMNYTLRDGEQLLMEYTDRGRKAQRGDVIVVRVENYTEIKKKNEGKPPAEQLKFVIKRLIAIEGDVVRCSHGKVEIKYAGTANFEPLDEPYAFYPTTIAKSGYNFAEYTVGKGEIFFLGDNRTNSTDSRYKEEGGSNLKGRLYQAEDIIGVVPDWAMKHQNILEKLFF